LVAVAARAGVATGAGVTLGVRAEHMALEPASDSDGIHVVVQAAELLGDASYVYLTPDGGTTQLIARVDAEALWKNGQMARVRVAPERWHVFDQEGVALP
jgi:ABC-type sugar transport system ATPase subunit